MSHRAARRDAAKQSVRASADPPHRRRRRRRASATLVPARRRPSAGGRASTRAAGLLPAQPTPTPPPPPAEAGRRTASCDVDRCPPAATTSGRRSRHQRPLKRHPSINQPSFIEMYEASFLGENTPYLSYESRAVNVVLCRPLSLLISNPYTETSIDELIYATKGLRYETMRLIGLFVRKKTWI